MVEIEQAAVHDASNAMLYNTFPVVLGSADKTYEGADDWPAPPLGMPLIMSWWVFRRHKDAWRFCSRVLYSITPVPLILLA